MNPDSSGEQKQPDPAAGRGGDAGLERSERADQDGSGKGSKPRSGKASAKTVPVTFEDYKRFYDTQQGDLARLGREAGWLGTIFGSAKSAQLNIAGLAVVVLVIGWIVLVFTLDAGQRAENVKLLIPALTAVLGYVFGRKS